MLLIYIDARDCGPLINEPEVLSTEKEIYLPSSYLFVIRLAEF